MVNDKFIEQTVTVLLPKATTFLRQCPEPTVENFRRFLEEYEKQITGCCSLKNQGVSLASLNGEVDEALSRADLLAVIRYWYDVYSCDQQRPERLDLCRYVQRARNLDDGELKKIKPLISKLLCVHLHI